jgi:undecaprenyl-phosphate 4-deoxy-4-formamido-L-arabinose transferase
MDASLSVIVPVYNGAATLPALVDRLLGVLRPRQAPFEIVLVNDGSPDHSWDVIDRLAAAHAEVRGLCLMRNFGQHNALLCGIRAARFDVIVTLDDDLQNPPEEVPRLLAALAEGADVVYGTPARQRHGLARDLASLVTKWALQHAMGAATARRVSAFRALRARLREAFADFRGPYANIDVLLTWATTRFTAVRVRHDPRAAGASNYTVRKLMRHALNMVTGFSALPLRLAALSGLAATAFGALVLVYVLGRYFVGGSPPGFPFLASIVALFSGAQLFGLAIIGEYLGRMHFRMMDRPTYALREQTAPAAAGRRCA